MNKVDPLGLMTWSEFVCYIAPILCENNSLPGGGPPPNPDGYSGWFLVFGGTVWGTGGVKEGKLILVQYEHFAGLRKADGKTICNYLICPGEDSSCGRTFTDILTPGQITGPTVFGCALSVGVLY